MGLDTVITDGSLALGDALPAAQDRTVAGRLESILLSGRFVVTAELSPPSSADGGELEARTRVLDGYVDAINASEASSATRRMSSLGACALLSRRGYETAMQLTCRDRNRIALQGDLLAAAGLGINNLLCMTGDHGRVGDEDATKVVFDLDGVALLRLARSMRREWSFGIAGRESAYPPRLLLGAVVDPFEGDREAAVDRLQEKVEAGARFVQTQYCFDVSRFRDFMARVRDRGLHEACHLLVGVGPIASAKAAVWMRRALPGVCIPDEVVERIGRAERPRQEGKKLCMELIQQLREVDGVSGVHVMAHRQEEAVAEIVDASGVLEGRIPWYPKRDTYQHMRAIP